MRYDGDRTSSYEASEVDPPSRFTVDKADAPKVILYDAHDRPLIRRPAGFDTRGPHR